MPNTCVRFLATSAQLRASSLPLTRWSTSPRDTPTSSSVRASRRKMRSSIWTAQRSTASSRSWALWGRGVRKRLCHLRRHHCRHRRLTMRAVDRRRRRRRRVDHRRTQAGAHHAGVARPRRDEGSRHPDVTARRRAVRHHRAVARRRRGEPLRRAVDRGTAKASRALTQARVDPTQTEEAKQPFR